MKLFDNSFTAAEASAATEETLRRDHARTIQEAIRWATYQGRDSITVSDWTPDEQQELIEVGFDVDTIGDRLWIHWPIAKK